MGGLGRWVYTAPRIFALMRHPRSFEGVNRWCRLLERGVEPAGSVSSTGLSGRLGPRLSGTTTRKLGASWTTGGQFSPARNRGPRRGGPGPAKISTVKRRKARRPASWAGRPFRWRDRPDREVGPRVRRSAPALCGASPSSSFSRRTGRTAAGSRSFPGSLTLICRAVWHVYLW